MEVISWEQVFAGIAGAVSALLVQFFIRLIFEPIRAFHVERVKVSTWLNVYDEFYGTGPTRGMGRRRKTIADALINAADDLRNTYSLVPTTIRASGILGVPEQMAVKEAVHQIMVLALVRPEAALISSTEIERLAERFSIQVSSRTQAINALLDING